MASRERSAAVTHRPPAARRRGPVGAEHPDLLAQRPIPATASRHALSRTSPLRSAKTCSCPAARARGRDSILVRLISLHASSSRQLTSQPARPAPLPQNTSELSTPLAVRGASGGELCSSPSAPATGSAFRCRRGPARLAQHTPFRRSRSASSVPRAAWSRAPSATTASRPQPWTRPAARSPARAPRAESACTGRHLGWVSTVDISASSTCSRRSANGRTASSASPQCAGPPHPRQQVQRDGHRPVQRVLHRHHKPSPTRPPRSALTGRRCSPAVPPSPHPQRAREQRLLGGGAFRPRVADPRAGARMLSGSLDRHSRGSSTPPATAIRTGLGLLGGELDFPLSAANLLAVDARLVAVVDAGQHDPRVLLV